MHRERFSPVADFKGNRWLAIPVYIAARATRTCRDACWDRLPVVAGKTIPAFPAHAHPQFYVSGKRPISYNLFYKHHTHIYKPYTRRVDHTPLYAVWEYQVDIKLYNVRTVWFHYSAPTVTIISKHIVSPCRRLITWRNFPGQCTRRLHVDTTDSWRSTFYIFVQSFRDQNMWAPIQVEFITPPYVRRLLPTGSANPPIGFVCCNRTEPLEWRHNQRESVSNHLRLDCLFNCLFGRR